jgi:TRAP transporter TAXI family solute receptor
MRKNKIFVFTLLITVFLASYLFAQPKQLIFTTGAMGGGFYAIGGGMAAYINNVVKTVSVTAQASGGVNENLNRLDTGVADIGLSSHWDAYQAYRGEGQFKKRFTNMLGLGVLFKNWSEPYALKKSGIKTFSDLKGKKISVGAAGGSMHKFMSMYLKAHGIDPEKDVKLFHLPPMESVDALRDGRIDAVMEIAAIPTAALTDLSTTHPITIIEFAPGLREKFLKENPMFVPLTIPAGTYKGVDKDVPTVGMLAIWACRKDLPEDIVYEIVKAIYSPEGLAYLRKVHAAAQSITREDAAKNMPIPLHPGAIKFYKETGLL